jgi:hypothetical protein
MWVVLCCPRLFRALFKGISMDFQKLGKDASKSDHMTRAAVPNRVLQHDTDFSCYECANLDEPASKAFKRILDKVNMDRVMVGAEHVNMFITLGEKSGREDMATVKVYQEERDPNKPIKILVREIRHLLANATELPDNMSVVVGLHHEADDLMCRYQNSDIENSVIMSGDKDLWMVQGKHADPKSARIWTVDGYGQTAYRDVGNTKPKLIGEGYSWFWHQMIMGDSVDKIPGLPKISNSMLDVYTPLKSGKPRNDGFGLCGESKAVEVLKGVTTCKEAMKRVYELYWETYRGRAMEMFIEQAYLLWMQRNDNPWDVLYYLTDLGMKVRPTERQIKVVGEFKERRSASIHTC